MNFLNFTQQKHRGFTIVELLIVIVVIAILAAITIVAYNGVQQRAVNSVAESEASQAVKLLKAYYTINGTYPAITNGANSVCVGEGFTSYTGDANGDCWDSKSSVVRSVDPNFNATLANVGVMNSASKPTIPYSTVSFTGPVFSTPSEANNPTGTYVVRYWVYGSTCPIGSKIWAGTVVVTSQCGIGLE